MKQKSSAIDKIIGHNLRQFRAVASISMQDLAKDLNVSYQQVQKYEKGVNRIPSVTLYRISQILDVPMLDFFAGVDNSTIKSSSVDHNMITKFNRLDSQSKSHIRSLIDIFASKAH